MELIVLCSSIKYPITHLSTLINKYNSSVYISVICKTMKRFLDFAKIVLVSIAHEKENVLNEIYICNFRFLRLLVVSHYIFH